MRKLVLAVSAVAALGLTLPLTTTSANAEKVVIKTGHRDHAFREHRRHTVMIEHRGHRDEWRRAHAEGSKKIIIKRGHRDHFRD